MPTYYDFGKAIELLKAGNKVTRKGWNGKGMYLMLVYPETLIDVRGIDITSEGFNKDTDYLPSIAMKTADDKLVVGWLASQADMLVEDWVIVE